MSDAHTANNTGEITGKMHEFDVNTKDLFLWQPCWIHPVLPSTLGEVKLYVLIVSTDTFFPFISSGF